MQTNLLLQLTIVGFFVHTIIGYLSFQFVIRHADVSNTNIILIQSLILGVAFLILVLFHIWEEYLKDQRGEILYIRRATNREYKSSLLNFYNWLLNDQGNPLEDTNQEEVWTDINNKTDLSNEKE